MRERPASGLLHPGFCAALLVLLLNDHVLKTQAPGTLSGKLSDVAGLVFFPLLLQAGVEIVQGARGRWRGPSRTVLGWCMALTGLVFIAIQLSPTAGQVWAVVWGWLQWPLQPGFPSAPAVPVAHVADPTDLLALPALAVAWALGGTRDALPQGQPAMTGTRDMASATASSGYSKSSSSPRK